jgi:hypothetical protein
MFINDKLIFLQLHKTGTSSIASFIHSVRPGKIHRNRYGDKHIRLEMDADGRTVLGSVRDPFAWYVSLWAYGCAGKGELRWRLTAPYHKLALSTVKRDVVAKGEFRAAVQRLRAGLRNDPRRWRRLYSDPNDVALFREWLVLMMSPEGIAQTPGAYPRLPLSSTVGFYTYRFLYTFTDYRAWDRSVAGIKTIDEARSFLEKAGIVQTFIRIEDMAHQLPAVLKDLGEDVPEMPQKAPVNRSSHRQIGDYYDTDTIALIRARDRLMFEMFGYPQSPVRQGGEQPCH